jgi:hypothetical protein
VSQFKRQRIEDALNIYTNGVIEVAIFRGTGNASIEIECSPSILELGEYHILALRSIQNIFSLD